MESWKAVAAERGGVFIQDSDTQRLEVTVCGVPIVVDTYPNHRDRMNLYDCRVRAAFVHEPGPNLKVAQENTFVVIGKVFGLQDHQIGHEHFDNSFRIKGESAAIARQLLSDDARIAMLRWFRNATLESNPKGIQLVEAADWDDVHKIHAAVALIADLASRDLHGREILQRIDGGVLSADQDGWPRVELDTGVRVVIRADASGERLVMVARSNDRAAIAKGTFAIEAGKLIDSVTLPQRAQVAVQHVGTGTLTVDEQGSSFRWPELEIPPEQLRAGADLLGALANADAHAYR